MVPPMARTVTPPRRTAPPPDSVLTTLETMRHPEDGKLWGIAELAGEFGISTRTIRFYEDKGLLEPARANGARVYTRRDRARLVIILRAKQLGSTLEEIRHYLDLYGAHGEGRARQLEYVVQRTERAIQELEAKRAQLDRSLDELRVIRDTARGHLAERRTGGRRG